MALVHCVQTILMHLSIVCPTCPTSGKGGGSVVGDGTGKYGPRGGAMVTCIIMKHEGQRSH